MLPGMVGVTCPTDLPKIFILVESDMFKPFMLMYRIPASAMYETAPPPKLKA